MKIGLKGENLNFFGISLELPFVFDLGLLETL
jgi:hypothetical protein